MNIRDLEWAAVHRSYAFNLTRSLIVIPNVSCGGFLWGEADLIAVSRAFYLTEGEVKTSVSDFRADFKKRKYDSGLKENSNWLKDIKKHYFIVPKDIAEKAGEILEEKNSMSGLIEVSKNRFNDLRAHEIRPAIVNKKAVKIPAERVMKISRLIAFRYWSSR